MPELSDQIDQERLTALVVATVDAHFTKCTSEQKLQVLDSARLRVNEQAKDEAQNKLTCWRKWRTYLYWITAPLAVLIIALHFFPVLGHHRQQTWLYQVPEKAYDFCAKHSLFTGLVLISGILGSVFTRLFCDLLDHALDYACDYKNPFTKGPDWLPVVIGVTERLTFSVLVAYDQSLPSSAMIGWAALKGAAHWNSFKEETKPYAFAAFLGTLVSLLFAILGGLCWRKGWPL